MNSFRLIVLAFFTVPAMVGAQILPEPRIEPLPESDWAGSVTDTYQEFADTGMRNLAGTYANRDVLAVGVMPHLKYLWTESTLAPRERALLVLRTAWLTRSDYLWAHRAALARSEGFTDDDLERVARGPGADGWSAFERLLLLAADEMHIDSFISDSTWNGLSERYDTAQMIDVIDTAGALTMHAGVANTLGVQIEDGIGEPMPDLPWSIAAERTNVRLIGREARIPPRAPAGGGPVTANVFSTFNHNPAADRVRGQINQHVNSRVVLEPRHREMLLVRIGILTRSEYEYAAHLRVGMRVGMTEADVALVHAAPEDRIGSELDIALMRATDELYEDDFVSDEVWRALAAELSTEQLLDVLICVGGYRSNSILISAAGVQLDDNMADFRFPEELR
jgi:4-carboxymuconolactone decarboxylase